MKIKIWLIIATVMCVTAFCALPVLAQYGGGNGTAEDPYLIYTAEQMNAIGADSNDWDKHFKLMTDIDLEGYNGTEFNIIGTGYIICNWIGECTFFRTPFTGTFDGDGFEIRNFKYSVMDSDFIYCIGLFGVVEGPDAEIKNLTLVEPHIDVDPGDRIGSLIGCLAMGTVTGCYVQAGNVSADYRVGGLVGHAGNGVLISECYATGNVSGHAELGGLVGSTYYSTISNCYSAGSVNGSGLFVGGLVGGNYYGSILDCYSTGSVSATSWHGGLVGENRGVIYHCYSTGQIAGTGTHIGGLVGWGSEAVTGSFWDTETSGQMNSNGGSGKTTVEMQDVNTYLSAGWDFTTPIWKMCEKPDYPRLWWECPPPVEAEVKIRPKTLNLASKGKWISCKIWLPEDYNVADVNSATVFLEDEIPAEWIWFNEKQNVVTAKFARSELQEILEPGEVDLTVTGYLTDGSYFEGTDTIRVIDKGKAKQLRRKRRHK
jgi:hypothetical protein